MKLDTLTKVTNIPLEKRISIKHYLPIKDKFKFIDEYNELIEKHKDEYPNYLAFVEFIFFNLMVVKTYTNIELELTYEEYDVLNEYKILDKVIESMFDDYNILTSMLQLNGINNGIK